MARRRVRCFEGTRETASQAQRRTDGRARLFSGLEEDVASGGNVRPMETGRPCEATGTGRHAAEVAQTTAAVDGGVAIENLLPRVGARRADPKVETRNRREVAGDENVGIRWCAPCEEM